MKNTHVYEKTNYIINKNTNNNTTNKNTQRKTATHNKNK